MNEMAAAPPADEIKKLHIKETILFAINNVPGVDPPTLEKLLELVNATGTFGVMSQEEILGKMGQMLKYVPGTCIQSLLILVDLLDIEVSSSSDFPALLKARPKINSLPASAGEVRSLPSRKVQ
jgi:hypothetical protein